MFFHTYFNTLDVHAKLVNYSFKLHLISMTTKRFGQNVEFPIWNLIFLFVCLFVFQDCVFINSTSITFVTLAVLRVLGLSARNWS